MCYNRYSYQFQLWLIREVQVKDPVDDKVQVTVVDPWADQTARVWSSVAKQFGEPAQNLFGQAHIVEAGNLSCFLI